MSRSSPGKILSQRRLLLEPHKSRKQSGRFVCTSRGLPAQPSQGVSSPGSVQAHRLLRLGTGALQRVKESNPAQSWDIAESSLSSWHSGNTTVLRAQTRVLRAQTRALRRLTVPEGEMHRDNASVQSDDHKPACTVGFLSLCFAQTKRPETLDLLNILHKCCCHYRLSLWKGVQ